MECEQRGAFEHEMALWNGLKGAAGDHGMTRGVATKCVAAMRLAEVKRSIFPGLRPPNEIKENLREAADSTSLSKLGHLAALATDSHGVS